MRERVVQAVPVSPLPPGLESFHHADSEDEGASEFSQNWREIEDLWDCAPAGSVSPRVPPRYFHSLSLTAVLLVKSHRPSL